MQALCRSWLALAVLLVLGPAAPAAAQQAAHGNQRGVALVIGNSAYREAPALGNPSNDATAVAAVLKDLAFDVTLATDQDAAGLRASVQAFLAKLGDAEIVFVYYAGHGVQMDGQNYLVPVDATLGSVDAFRGSLVSVSDILKAVEAAAPADAAKLIILDACRNNPFADAIARETGQPSRGLARLDDATAAPQGKPGTAPPQGYFRIVAFATAPGDVAEDGAGSHSPYTRSFLRFARQPGIEIGEMFRLVAADVISETNGRQKPEYLVQTSRALFLRNVYITDCDRLAIEGQNFLGAAGVPFDDVDAAKAVPACEKAVAEQPDSARLNNNLARAYEKAERLQEAFKHYEISADLGYPPAINALGIMYLSGCGLPAPDITRGAEMLIRARELGNLSAKAGLTKLDLLRAIKPDGITRIQTRLKADGAYAAAIDGTSSDALKASLASYQAARGLAQNGLTLETVHALGVEDVVPKKFKCH